MDSARAPTEVTWLLCYAPGLPRTLFLVWDLLRSKAGPEHHAQRVEVGERSVGVESRSSGGAFCQRLRGPQGDLQQVRPINFWDEGEALLRPSLHFKDL